MSEEPMAQVDRLGERPASTGGMVDLDRLLGVIPVVLVFTGPPGSHSSRSVMGTLGRHLADFGRERIQVLGVVPVGVDAAAAATEEIEGNLRVLSDPDGDLAGRFGVEISGDGPVLVLIDAEGRHAGTWTEVPGPGLAEEVERLLAGRDQTKKGRHGAV